MNKNKNKNILKKFTEAINTVLKEHIYDVDEIALPDIDDGDLNISDVQLEVSDAIKSIASNLNYDLNETDVVFTYDGVVAIRVICYTSAEKSTCIKFINNIKAKISKIDGVSNVEGDSSIDSENRWTVVINTDI